VAGASASQKARRSWGTVCRATSAKLNLPGERRAKLRCVERSEGSGPAKGHRAGCPAEPDLLSARVKIESHFLLHLRFGIARREHFDANLRCHKFSLPLRCAARQQESTQTGGQESGCLKWNSHGQYGFTKSESGLEFPKGIKANQRQPAPATAARPCASLWRTRRG